MTNNFELSPLEIARLYKYRWMIELFFKWIKQHLKVKAFWGYSMNAVKTQTIYRDDHLPDGGHCETPLNKLFSNTDPQYVKELKPNQLDMFTL